MCDRHILGTVAAASSGRRVRTSRTSRGWCRSFPWGGDEEVSGTAQLQASESRTHCHNRAMSMAMKLLLSMKRIKAVEDGSVAVGLRGIASAHLQP